MSAVAFAAFNTVVGSGIFALPGQVAAVLGPAAIVAYLICSFLVGLLGLSFAELGSRVSCAGGLYAYVRIAFGPITGGIAGALVLTSNSAVSSAAVAVFLSETLALTWPELNHPIPRALFLGVVYLCLACVNIRGTRAGAQLSIAMALIKLAPLAILILVGAFSIHPQFLHWNVLPTTKALGQGTILLFFAFTGVEGGLYASSEILNPSRTVPRGIALALVLIAALYIGLQFVAQGILGPELATSKAPLIATASALWGTKGAFLLSAAMVFSVLGYLSSDMLGSPRCLFALAESGQLPKPLAKVSPRFYTPAVAIGVYAALCFLIATLGSFRQLAVVSVSGNLVLYLLCCLSLIRLRAKKFAMSGQPFQAPGGYLVPLAAALIMIWLLCTLEWSELVAAAGIVACAGAIYGIREYLERKPGASTD